MRCILTIALFTCLPAYGRISPRAKVCADKLFAAYDAIPGYVAVLRKTEQKPRNGKLLNKQHIRLTHRKPDYVKIEFLDEGSTGIKNNGMVTEYLSDRKTKITWGKPTAAGAMMNKAARAIVGNEPDLYSKYVTDEELLVLTKTTTTAFLDMLKKNIKEIGESTMGGLDVAEGSECRLRYTPHAPVSTKVFSGIAELEATETEMGSMALFWLFLNLDKFDSISDFYKNFAGKKINVSTSALPFELLMGKENLPKELRFFHKEKEVAAYIFEEFKPLK